MNGIRSPRRARLLAGASWAALACWAPASAAELDAGTEQQLRDAITAANASPDASSTITLTGSFVVSSTALPAANKALTIVTNGFTLSGTGGSGAQIGLPLGAAAALTIQGSITGGAPPGTGQGGTGLNISSTAGGSAMVVNNGTITGGAATGPAGGGTPGGIGIAVGNATLVNNGVIIGGATPGYTGANSNPGVGVSLTGGGSLVNSANATILGGSSLGVGAGAGVFMASGSGTLTNNGTIRGGSDLNGVEQGTAAIQTRIGTYSITNAGTLEGGNRAAAYVATSSSSGATIVNSGAIRAGADGTIAIQFSATGTSTLELRTGSLIVGNVLAGSGAGDTLRLTGAGTTILDGGIGAGGQYRGFDILQKTGTGTWILTGESAIASTFQLQQGTLQIGNGGTTGSLAGNIANAGTLVFNRSDTLTHAGVISGAGAVQQSGSGTTILTGINTFTGGTTIHAGTLAITQDAALGAATGALTFNGGALRFDAGFTLAATRAITLAAGGGTIDANGFTTKVSQAIAGAGTLTVTGGGTLVLTGANTHAGGTVISAATLAIAADGALGAATGPLVFNGGTLRFDAGTTLAAARSIGITAAGGAIDTHALTSTVAGAISGPGGLTVTGGGTLILTGENSYTGGTGIAAATTLSIGNGGATGSIVGNIANNGTLIVNRSGSVTLPGVISGTGALIVTGGGTVILTGENSYTGGTTISAGTLQIGDGGTSGSLMGDIRNDSPHTLVFNRSGTLVIPGVISGIGAVRQEGSGVTVLSGANTYSGATSVNAGTLRAGAAGAFSPNSVVTVAAGATLDLAGLDQSVAGLANAGLVRLGGAPGTVLTVAGNYTGNGGVLALNTTLGGDGSASDRLVIQGGTASGSTGLRIANIGGAGAQTVEGIRVVQAVGGGGTAAGAFRLDTRAAAGAYEYRLFRGGNASADDWYLRSFLPEQPVSPENPVTPASPGVPLYRPEVPLYAPISAVGRQMGLVTLGTLGSLHERVGELDIIRDLQGRSPYANGAWARTFGERSRNRWDGTVDARAAGNLIGLQAGFDILRTNPYGGGHRDHVGVYVAYTDYNAPDVSGFAIGQQQRVGRLLMSGPAVGAYWTHFGPSGWYVDAVVQANWFEVTARSDFGAGLSTDGTGYAASLEAGYPIRFAQGWQIEPQAQVIWQGVSVDRARDAFSTVAWDEGDAVTGRLGARLQYTGRDERTVWQPYAKLNLWHVFSGTDRISFGSGRPIENAFGQTALEVGAGLTARVSEIASLYAHADYRWAFDGDARGTAVQGSIGIRFNW